MKSILFGAALTLAGDQPCHHRRRGQGLHQGRARRRRGRPRGRATGDRCRGGLRRRPPPGQQARPRAEPGAAAAAGALRTTTRSQIRSTTGGRVAVMAPAARAVTAGLRAALRGGLALVYPPTCPGCGGAIADPACPLPRLLVGPASDRAALLPALRDALRRRSRHRRAALSPRHRRSAGLRAGAGGGPLRGRRPRPRAPAEIRGPARSRPPCWRG